MLKAILKVFSTVLGIVVILFAILVIPVSVADSPIYAWRAKPSTLW